MRMFIQDPLRLASVDGSKIHRGRKKLNGEWMQTQDGLPSWLRWQRIGLQRRRPGFHPWVRSLGWEISLEKEIATYSSILAWRIPWTEEPSGLQSTVSQSRTQRKRLSRQADPGQPQSAMQSALKLEWTFRIVPRGTNIARLFFPSAMNPPFVSSPNSFLKP